LSVAAFFLKTSSDAKFGNPHIPSNTFPACLCNHLTIDQERVSLSSRGVVVYMEKKLCVQSIRFWSGGGAIEREFRRCVSVEVKKGNLGGLEL
jgi:hypothetical protein